MTHGGIAGWKKKEGEFVASGDILAEIQTDKATMEMESMEEGWMAKIIVPEGTEDIPVGQPVAVLCEEEADIAAFKDYVPVENTDVPPGTSAPEAAPARAVLERPDYRPIGERSVPLTTGLASKPLEAGAAALAPVLDADSPVMTVRDALNSALAEEMERDEKVFVMGEEVGDYQARTRSRRACYKSLAPSACATRPSPRLGSLVLALVPLSWV